MRTCPVCQKKFVDRAALRAHVAKVHPDSPAAQAVNTVGRQALDVMEGESRLKAVRSHGKTFLGLPSGAFGDTFQGEQWAARALHPCMSDRIEPEGIPDSVNVTAAEPGWRLNTSVGPPEGLIGELWDCCILIPPLDAPSAIVARGGSGTDFGTNVPWQAGQRVDLDFPGRITGLGPTDVPWSTENSTALRTTYKGITVYLDAPDLYNQGRVYGWQGARTVGWRDVTTSSGAVSREGSIQIPLNEESLVALSDSTYQVPAKEGIYMPMRFVQPTHRWQPTRFGSLDESRAFVRGFNAESSTPVVAIPQGPFTPSYPCTDDNTQLGVIIFRGLSANAKLMIKLRKGEELAPAAGSVLIPFATPSPDHDPKALEVVSQVQARLPYAYPASANSLGAILAAVVPILRQLAPVVFPAIGSLLGKVFGPRESPRQDQR